MPVRSFKVVMRLRSILPPKNSAHRFPSVLSNSTASIRFTCSFISFFEQHTSKKVFHAFRRSKLPLTSLLSETLPLSQFALMTPASRRRELVSAVCYRFEQYSIHASNLNTSILFLAPECMQKTYNVQDQKVQRKEEQQEEG